MRVVIALDALFIAYGHAPLALFLGQFFGTGVPLPRPPPVGLQPSSGLPFFFALGAYFLIATIIYVLGAVFVASGKLQRISSLGLIILAAVDNILLAYTRLVPENVFFNRLVPWSSEWFPRLGTVQVLAGQTILIVLCAVSYKRKE